MVESKKKSKESKLGFLQLQQNPEPKIDQISLSMLLLAFITL